MGLTPETSESSVPLQLLTNDGSLYFNPKADLLKYFQANYPDIYISDKVLMERTNDGATIAAWICDCMFTFRTLKASKNVTYDKLCRTKASQTVKPIFKKLTTSPVNFKKTGVQVFDRGADPTKGAMERKCGHQQTGPFQYSDTYKVDFKEKLPNYGKIFRDRAHGRKKIINTYARWFEHKENNKRLALPDDCRHIVVGGEEDKVTAFETTRNKEIILLNPDDFKSKHPEADTGVFHAFHVLLEKYEYPENTSFVIDCPETDCLTISLLEFSKIKCILNEKNVNLYLKMHIRKVDANGEVAKTKRLRKSVAENSIRNEDFYIDFRKIEEVLADDEVFGTLNYPAESIGLISILTGNDKTPGFRSCTKNMHCKQTKR